MSDLGTSLLYHCAHGQNTREIHLSRLNYVSLKSGNISNTHEAFTTSSGLITGFSVTNASLRHRQTSMEPIFRHLTPNEYNRNHRINGCEKINKDSLTKPIHRKTSFYVQAGVAASILKTTQTVYGSSGYDLNVNSQAKAGIEFALQLNHYFSKQFSINLDLCYNSRKMEYAFHSSGHPPVSSKEYDVQAPYLGFAILPQIEEPTAETRFFFQAGPQVGRYLSVSGTEVITTSLPYLSRSEKKYHGMSNFPVPVWEVGLCTGIGVRDIRIGKQYYIIGLRTIP